MRKRWTKLLAQNLRLLGRQIEPGTSVVQDWDRLEVRVPSSSAEVSAAFVDLLQRTPGIANFSEVKAYPLRDIPDILDKTLPEWRDQLRDKTFCVRVKRTGRHDFSSTEVERYVGSGLRGQVQTAGVRLKDPDLTVRIDIKDREFFVVCARYPGLGGFPLGTQDPVISLVSGGFDSTVASFDMIKRGMRTHFCFFNLGGRAHEVGVKEIAYYLWRKYSASHRVRFIAVPFEGVVSEIMEKISPANMGVVLKRMMFRAASQIARRNGIQALVTGEAIAQVSSQTIPNLSAIDRVADMMVLRPLITAAKPDIIGTARDIGVEDFANNVPEYCGVIAVKPSARVNLQQLQAEEEDFDFARLDQAVAQASNQPIDRVMDDGARFTPVAKLASLPQGGIVIDIRHPHEREFRPLHLARHDILQIPFYKLNTEFEKLAPDRHYYLYCEKSVMSELHAAHLIDAGYANVDVYQPK